MVNLYRAQCRFLAAMLLVSLFAICVTGQTTAFTYQGLLNDNSLAANGNFDLQFGLFDLAQNGSQKGSTITLTNVPVVNGIFTVQLDFGSPVFTSNSAQFMEIGVRPGGKAGAFSVLAPRVPLTPTPYSIRTLSAATADTATTATTATNATTAANATQLGGIAANQYVVTTDTRLTDARAPTAGSSSYIHNGAGLQSASNFNISGNGTAGGTLSANAVNAVTQYNLGGSAILSTPALKSTVIGLSAFGTPNSTVVGFQAGGPNSTGITNTFIGAFTGMANTSGGDNTFVGSNGTANTTGGNNSFFGAFAGNANTTGSLNSFLGNDAGSSNLDGAKNVFVGDTAGEHNTSGGSNSFLGFNTGLHNTTGSNITLVGANTDAVVDGLTQSTAIGANATVSNSNTIVLGTATETTQVPGKLTVTGLTAFTTLGTAGATGLCRNASNQLATCSSSLRYKTNLTPYGRGMEIIDHLNPIAFTWKEGGMRDLGFGAEDVARIEPLLVTYNAQGQVEGLKYDRITVALVNAVKEQQKQIADQNQQINALKNLVCVDHPSADICKQK